MPPATMKTVRRTERMAGAARTLPSVTLIAKGGHPRVAIALGLVGGLIALVDGITIAAWLLIVAGVLSVVGAGLIWVDLLRKRSPRPRRSGRSFED